MTGNILILHKTLRVDHVAMASNFDNETFSDALFSDNNVNKAFSLITVAVNESQVVKKHRKAKPWFDKDCYMKKAVRQSYQNSKQNVNTPEICKEHDDLVREFQNIIDKIHTHSLRGFLNYIKVFIFGNYEDHCHVSNCYICKP